mmetsp:Transcript_22499/g.39787  ORF Transcript_22499/g.39787 Transcript_22499/m.39787 type:complete len:87 (-) Transcript_22499:206-466(-)
MQRVRSYPLSSTPILERAWSKQAKKSVQAIIKIVAMKTKQVLDKVKSIIANSGSSAVKLADFSKVKLPPGMDRYLFDLAIAERMAG